MPFRLSLIFHEEEEEEKDTPEKKKEWRSVVPNLAYAAATAAAAEGYHDNPALSHPDSNQGLGLFAPSLCCGKNVYCCVSLSSMHIFVVVVVVIVVVWRGENKAKMTPATYHLDEEEIPSLLLHHIAPANALEFSSSHGRVVDLPEISQQFGDATKRSKVRGVAQPTDAFLKHGSKGRGGGRGRAGDEERPDERAVETVGTRGDEVHEFSELCDEVTHACLGRGVAGDQRAEVYASGDAEHGCDVDGELFGTDGARGGEAALNGSGGKLGCADGVGESLHVFANHDFVNVAEVALDVQAGDLGDEEHDFVVAAHQLRETNGAVLHVQLAVRVGEDGLATHDGGA